MTMDERADYRRQLREFRERERSNDEVTIDPDPPSIRASVDRDPDITINGEEFWVLEPDTYKMSGKLQ